MILEMGNHYKESSEQDINNASMILSSMCLIANVNDARLFKFNIFNYKAIERLTVYSLRTLIASFNKAKKSDIYMLELQYPYITIKRRNANKNSQMQALILPMPCRSR